VIYEHEFMPLEIGVQVPRCIHPEASQKGIAAEQVEQMRNDAGQSFGVRGYFVLKAGWNEAMIRNCLSNMEKEDE